MDGKACLEVQLPNMSFINDEHENESKRFCIHEAKKLVTYYEFVCKTKLLPTTEFRPTWQTKYFDENFDSFERNHLRCYKHKYTIDGVDFAIRIVPDQENEEKKTYFFDGFWWYEDQELLFKYDFCFEDLDITGIVEPSSLNKSYFWRHTSFD